MAELRRTQTLNIRWTPQELRRLRMEAKVRGWSVGKLVRARALGEEREIDKRLADVERQLKEMGNAS